jgi:hypothetical protein
MKAPAFLRDALFGAALALGASIAVTALLPFAGPAASLRLLIPALALAYLVFTLIGASRTGRVTTFSLWAAGAAGLWLWSPGLMTYIALHVGAVWFIRSVYRYDRLLPALADLALCVASVAAAAWAVSRSGSVFLATWCLFLVQALSAAIPRGADPRDPAAPAGGDAFDDARRRAEEALTRLASD